MNKIIRQSDRRDAARRISTTGRTALFLAVIFAILSCMAGCDIFDEILNEGKAPAFTAFSFSGQRGTATIDRDKRTVKATAECSVNLAGVTPQFTLSEADATATADGESQRSGLTAVNFSHTVAYTLTSADGKATAVWNVTVELPGDCPEDADAQTPAITAQPQPATYALNATAAALTVTASVSDGGTLSYKWYSNTASSTSGGTAVGTNSRSYTPPTTAAGTRYYYVTVTNTNSAAKGAKTASATSAAVAVTVESGGSTTVNAQAPSITAQPQSATYTQNATATALSVTATVTDGGTLSYQWYSNTASSTSGGTAVGTNSRTYTPPTTATGTRYYYVTVTNTNNSVNGTKTATATSSVATVTVNAGGSNPGGDGTTYEKLAVKYHVKDVGTGSEFTCILSHDSHGDRTRTDMYASVPGMGDMHTHINIINHPLKESWSWIFVSGWTKLTYVNDPWNGIQYQKGMSLEDYFKKIGFVEQGKMTVLGKECRVFAGKTKFEDGGEYNAKWAAWNGIWMYMETEPAGNQTTGKQIWTATAYTFDVPAKAFDRSTIEVDWIK